MKYPNYFLAKKAAAGSLILTLVLSLLISIACCSLLLLLYFHGLMYSGYAEHGRLNNNVESAINIVLADTSINAARSVDSLNLFGSTEDPVVISKELWGLQQFVSVKAIGRRIQEQRSFLCASGMPAELKAALFLADHQRPLQFSGKGKINGDLFLPKAGLLKNTHDTEVELSGNFSHVSDSLPLLNDQLNFYLDSFLNKFVFETADQNTSLLNSSESIEQDFLDTALIIRSKEEIILRTAASFKGKVIIASAKEIMIEEGAQLDNILLWAPVIRFKNGFRGILQAFATDSLIVGSDCSFGYPSSLLLIKPEAIDGKGFIEIGTGTEIKGIVIGVTRGARAPAIFASLDENTVVTGIVYINGYLEEKGVVNGCILTDFFMYRSTTGNFENNFHAPHIDRKMLPEFFVCPAIFKSSTRLNITQWQHNY